MKIQFLLKNTGMYERLGIMTLSSVLKKRGHDVRLNLTEEAGEKRIVKHVTDYKPDVLAYSVMTGEHIYHIELNQMVKSHYNNAISVLVSLPTTSALNSLSSDNKILISSAFSIT